MVQATAAAAATNGSPDPIKTNLSSSNVYMYCAGVSLYPLYLTSYRLSLNSERKQASNKHADSPFHMLMCTCASCLQKLLQAPFLLLLAFAYHRLYAVFCCVHTARRSIERGNRLFCSELADRYSGRNVRSLELIGDHDECGVPGYQSIIHV